MRHVIVERRGDALLTGCGWLIWPGTHDARMPTPPTCITCHYLYTDDDTGNAHPRNP
ncbi:hypothetical protein [Amycolatopsis arida]|nr:hypothetical protein [Amycolatopsis arida]